MGGEQAATVMLTIKQEQLEREGKKALSKKGQEDLMAPILEKYEHEGNPYYSTARLWDDGILAPAETRQVLGLALSVALRAPRPEGGFGVFRM